jgi:hypothetical protein
MMLGDLPPSSVVTGTMRAAAARRMFAAVGRPPVKLILRTLGWVDSAGPMRPSPVTMLTTPFGKPACSMRRPNSSVETLACSDGLMTTVLPAASAGASLLASSGSGEFQAVISTATPSGSTSVKSKTSSPSTGIVWPCSLSAYPAKWR